MSPERYSIIQFGVCVWHENPDWRRFIKRRHREEKEARNAIVVLDISSDDGGDGDGDDNGGNGGGGGRGGEDDIENHQDDHVQNEEQEDNHNDEHEHAHAHVNQHNHENLDRAEIDANIQAEINEEVDALQEAAAFLERRASPQISDRIQQQQEDAQNLEQAMPLGNDQHEIIHRHDRHGRIIYSLSDDDTDSDDSSYEDETESSDSSSSSMDDNHDDDISDSEAEFGDVDRDRDRNNIEGRAHVNRRGNNDDGNDGVDNANVNPNANDEEGEGEGDNEYRRIFNLAPPAVDPRLQNRNNGVNGDGNGNGNGNGNDLRNNEIRNEIREAFRQRQRQRRRQDQRRRNRNRHNDGLDVGADAGAGGNAGEPDQGGQENHDQNERQRIRERDRQRRQRERTLRMLTRNTEPPEFHVRKYNFYLFPSSNSTSREVVLNPASILQMAKSNGGQGPNLGRRINGLHGNGHANGGAMNADVDDPDIIDLTNNDGGRPRPQDMNFNEWMKNGIPYTTLDQAEGILQQFQRDHDKSAKDKNDSKHSNGSGSKSSKNGSVSASNSTSARVTEWEEPTDPSDIMFIARTMASLREWIDSAALQTSRPLSDNMTLEQEQRIGIVKVIPVPKKESLRKCLRGKIEYEYPALHWDENDNQQVVVRLNEEEKKIRDARRKKFAWQKMHEEKIGFTRVFKALSDACRGKLGQTGDFDSEYEHFLTKLENDEEGNGSNNSGEGSECAQCSIAPVTAADLTKQAHVPQRKIPIIVHKGFLDFLFLLTHFQKHKLPPTYEEAKEILHEFFPNVYDTKILATEFSDNFVRTGQTRLMDLYRRYVRGEDELEGQNDILMNSNFIPRSSLVNGPRLNFANSRPEAGDKAFIVGAVFQCLCRRIAWKSLAAADSEVEDREQEFYKQIVLAGRSRVGSLLFLNERLPQTKLSAPLYGLNKVSLCIRFFLYFINAWQCTFNNIGIVRRHACSFFSGLYAPEYIYS